MNVDEFIDAVFMKYPPKTSNFKTLEDYYGEYRIGLKTSIDYDYRAAYEDLCANYQYSSTPYVYTLKNFLKNHIVHEANPLVMHLRQIREAPRLNFSRESEEYRERIRAKLAQIGIKSKIEALK